MVANIPLAEPEFRLPIMVTYLLFTATGFFAWGQAAYAENAWEVPVIVGLGLINFGIQLGTTGVVSYVVDCHRDKAGEAFATMNFSMYSLEQLITYSVPIHKFRDKSCTVICLGTHKTSN